MICNEGIHELGWERDKSMHHKNPCIDPLDEHIKANVIQLYCLKPS